MHLLQYMLKERFIHNYIWYRLCRRHGDELDAPEYTVTPVVKLVHSFHKKFTKNDEGVLLEVVDHIYNSRKNLKELLRGSFQDMRSENSSGNILAVLYIAFELADKFVSSNNNCNCDTIQVIINEVEFLFATHSTLSQKRERTWLSSLFGIVLAVTTLGFAYEYFGE